MPHYYAELAAKVEKINRKGFTAKRYRAIYLLNILIEQYELIGVIQEGEM